MRPDDFETEDEYFEAVRDVEADEAYDREVDAQAVGW